MKEGRLLLTGRRIRLAAAEKLFSAQQFYLTYREGSALPEALTDVESFAVLEPTAGGRANRRDKRSALPSVSGPTKIRSAVPSESRGGTQTAALTLGSRISKGTPMNRFISVVAVAAVVGGSMGVTACSKKADAGGGTAPSATAEVKGCGADYADPAKEYCVKLPAGYTAGKPDAPSELYSELINFNGPMSGFTVAVGFTSSNWKTYDDQLAADEKSMTTSSSIKVDGSGATAGGGKWWSFTNSGSKGFSSTTKSNGNKSIHCDPNNTNIAPEVIEACKSIRPYPK